MTDPQIIDADVVDETPPETGTELSLDLKMNLTTVTVIQDKIKDKFNTIYTNIEREIAQCKFDVSTTKGRDEIRSLAYKISQTKTGLFNAATQLTDEQKKMVKAVNSERSEMETHLNDLRDKVRSPLTEWEVADKARKQTMADKFNHLRGYMGWIIEGVPVADCSSETLFELLENLRGDEYDPDIYLDDLEDVKALRDSVVDALVQMHGRAAIREKEQAELEELRQMRADKEAQELADREAKEAEERAAKEKADQEAADKAEADRVGAETKRLAEEADVKAKADAQAAIDAEKEATRLADERAEQAETDRVAAAEQAEADKKAAFEKAEEDRLQAIEDERTRRAKVDADEKHAEEKRAADVEHRRKINGAAVHALVASAELNETQAKSVIAAIWNGHIPRVNIEY